MSVMYLITKASNNNENGMRDLIINSRNNDIFIIRVH